MPPSTHSGRLLEARHIKLLRILKDHQPNSVYQDRRDCPPDHDNLEELMRQGGTPPANPDTIADTKLTVQLTWGLPHMHAIEDMAMGGYIENPDPTLKRWWQLTRRGENQLQLEEQRVSRETQPAKGASKPPAPERAKETAGR